jgi:hypothetical protein
MPDSVIMWTLISLLFACFVMLLVLWVFNRNLNIRLQQSVNLIDELHKISLAQKKQFSDLEQDQNNLKTELRKRQHDVEHLQASAISRIEKVESTVERLEEQDPALKMYSKASKLVEQGAAMNDIIEASGLPRAEVEVLLSLHSRKS